MDRQRFQLFLSFGRVRSLMSVNVHQLAANLPVMSQVWLWFSTRAVLWQEKQMVYYDSCSARNSQFFTLHQLRPSAACFISVHHSLALKPCKLWGFRLALEIFIQSLPVLYFNIIQAAFSIPFGKGTLIYLHFRFYLFKFDRFRWNFCSYLDAAEVRTT